MYRDEYRLVTSADDDDPCISIEMVRRHGVGDDGADQESEDSAGTADQSASKIERVPVAGEIIPLNGHGYCASVSRCRQAPAKEPNGSGKSERRIVWNEQIDEVFDNLETCRIAIENAFEPDEFLK